MGELGVIAACALPERQRPPFLKQLQGCAGTTLYHSSRGASSPDRQMSGLFYIMMFPATVRISRSE